MASTGQAAVADNHIGLLDKERTIAPLNYNRWLVPPAAIAVHMCIGEVYGFSVFNVPLTQAGAGWTIPQVGWIYSIALFMLAASIEGESRILNATPIQRAHPRFVENLNALGADVSWVSSD